MTIPADLSSHPRGTILAVPGAQTRAFRLYVNGCRCVPGPQGGAPPQVNGHGSTVEAEACARRVIAARGGR